MKKIDVRLMSLRLYFVKLQHFENQAHRHVEKEEDYVSFFACSWYLK